MSETNRIAYKRELSEGFSIPRNKELMRVYKALDLLAQLGSGIPRILNSYDKTSFHFSDNFLRMVFPSAEPVYITEQVTPQDTPHVTPQDTEQVKNLLSIMDKAYSRKELMEKLGLVDREYFRSAYIQKGIELGFVELTIPDKPKSSKQKYKLTAKGKKARQK